MSFQFGAWRTSRSIDRPEARGVVGRRSQVVVHGAHVQWRTGAPARAHGAGLLLLGLTLLPVFVSACDSAPVDDAEVRYIVPPETGDGWKTAYAADVGVDVDMMEFLTRHMHEGGFGNLHAILLARGDRLFFENYEPGTSAATGSSVAYDRGMVHELYSVTKSVTGTLVGIAQDEGLIGSLAQPISTFFPREADLFEDSLRARITIEHLLTMSAGIQWDETTYPFSGDDSDVARLLLALPMESAPGTRFVYNSGLSILLGEIVKEASGTSADQFAEERLFEPLGIETYSWLKFPSGTVQAGSGLDLRPRDMAKLGALYLAGGVWNGVQIVSQDWVQQACTAKAPDVSYGYHWWIDGLEASDEVAVSCTAAGSAGQYIFVFPDFNLVAVFTAGLDQASWSLPYSILEQYVLPAVRR